MPDGTPGAGGALGGDAWRIFRANARDIERTALEALRPAPPLDIADWAEAHIRFAEGTPAEGPFRNATAPYLEDILRCLSPDSGVREVWVPKCAQSGGTVVIDIWLAAMLTAVTAPAMVVHPTLGQFYEWAEEKFWPMARESAALNPDPEDGVAPGALLPQITRSEGGSTKRKIKWRRGSRILGAGAESAPSLRQHTIRFMARDDLDGWTDDAGGEGDPFALSESRLTTYRELGLSIELNVSTPLIARASRIMRGYMNSDQGRYYMACLECGARTDFDWEDVRKNDAPPFEAHVVCPACGGVHDAARKRAMIAKESGAGWIPCREIGGEKPPKTIGDAEAWAYWRSRDMGPWSGVRGFWITGVISRFLNWNGLAKDEAEASGDQKAEMVFVNNKLGRPFDVKTQTPDWEVLAARSRSSEFERGRGAWGPLVFTLSVDVQRDGLYWLVKGYNANEEGWYLDWGFLAGETAEPNGEVWRRLTEIADRGAPLPGGVSWPFDQEAVDANYNTDAAKAWVQRRPRAFALNGAAGWGKPIIYRATESEVRATGKRKRFGGVKIWHVGTYPAKAVLVHRYSKTVKEATESGLPRGFCHFARNTDDALFQQLTSEYVHEDTNKATGLTRSVWKARGDNHWFDCDVYSLAAIDKIGARSGKRGSWAEEAWAEREAAIRAEIEAATGQSDLFDRSIALPPKPDGDPGSADRRSVKSGSAALAALAAQNRS